MAKAKKETESTAIGEGGTPEVLTEQVAATSELTSIETKEQAREFVMNNYTVPAESKVVIVTQDKNVFWQANASDATNHAKNQKLKIFRLSWD
jgi:hypothetical protein